MYHHHFFPTSRLRREDRVAECGGDARSRGGAINEIRLAPVVSSYLCQLRDR